ncbi:hypothetical protein VEE68_39080 [Escherichia coli]|nr:hypothetical protein VEE68_39080 [Escherichia coli]
MSKQRVFIAGHRGMVGSAIRRQLEQRGDVELVLRTRDELNLLDSRAVHDFFASESIDQVYLAAAKVGGIVANNTYPADFIYQNMMIESNIIHAAHQNDVNKLLFLGSSCIYPKLAKQPMAESELLQGTSGADQRALCHCQNCRDQTVRILQPPVRTRLPLSHADQPVWPA